MSAEAKDPTVETMPQDEASKGAPIPIWLIGGLILLVYLGMIYLNDHGGGFNGLVYAPYSSYSELEDSQPKDPAAKLRAQGRIIFNNACAACHQASGMGVPGQYPPLAGSEWVLSKTPTRMIHIVLNGLQGPVDVHGVAFSGAVQMPAWKGVYTKDEDIAAVISFVRGNKDWGNNASAATPEQVKVIRDQLKDRDAMMSVQDLQKLPE